jgi:hypothetical protein
LGKISTPFPKFSNLGLWGSAKGKLLERSFPLDTLQELSKKLYLTMFLEVFEIPKNFFQKVLWWGPGATPLAYKLQFAARSCDKKEEIRRSPL